MVLLGDVGERQEMRERPRHRQRRLDRQVAQHAGQRLDVAVPSGPAELRQRPHPLDRLVERLPLALPQRLAKQLAEQPHIVP